MNCHCSTAPVGKRMRDVGRKREKKKSVSSGHPSVSRFILGRGDILEGTAQQDRFNPEGGVLTAKLVPASSRSPTDPSGG